MVANAERLECPRCAYDLTGVEERFGSVRCAECGCKFLLSQVSAYRPFPSAARAVAQTAWPQAVAAPLTMFAPGAAQVLAMVWSLSLLNRVYARSRRPHARFTSARVLYPVLVLVNIATGAGVVAIWTLALGSGVIPW